MDGLPSSFETLLLQGFIDLSSGKLRFQHGSSVMELPLDEALKLGIVDSKSALVKDNSKCELLDLKRACFLGIIDSSNGVVYDTVTAVGYSFFGSLICGLLLIRDKPMSLLDVLHFGLFQQNSSTLISPFTLREFSFLEAVTSRFISGHDTLICHRRASAELSLKEAMDLGIMDPVTGALLDPFSDEQVELPEALRRELLISVHRKVDNATF